MWLFGYYKCAATIKDSETYYVQVKYKKGENQDKNKENLNNSNITEETKKLDKNDPNWYLLVVVRPFDQEKANLKVVPMQEKVSDNIEFNRLRINEP